MSEQREPISRGLILTNQFGDFDAFREAIQGWDLDFRQIDRGAFNGCLTHLITPSVVLTNCAMSRKVDQYGASPTGFRTFGLPADDNFHLRWRGRSAGPNSLFQFKGNELNCVSNPGFNVFTISVSELILEDAAARKGLSSVDEALPTADVVECPRDQLMTLRRLAMHLTTAAIARPSLLKDPNFHHQLETDLAESIFDTISRNPGEARSRPMACIRNRILRKALEVIEDRAAEPVTVTEVERQIGASSRTLRYAFEEEFSVSPKQYILAYRLNQARTRLRRAAPSSVRVSDVANELGYWHMGQFARDYRRMFDELPLDALQRSEHHQR